MLLFWFCCVNFCDKNHHLHKSYTELRHAAQFIYFHLKKRERQRKIGKKVTCSLCHATWVNKWNMKDNSYLKQSSNEYITCSQNRLGIITKSNKTNICCVLNIWGDFFVSKYIRWARDMMMTNKENHRFVAGIKWMKRMLKSVV